MSYYTSTIAALYSDPATLLHVEIPLKNKGILLAFLSMSLSSIGIKKLYTGKD